MKVSKYRVIPSIVIYLYNLIFTMFVRFDGIGYGTRRVSKAIHEIRNFLNFCFVIRNYDNFVSRKEIIIFFIM